MDEVTIIIKTLDRCDCLINLLDSIFKKYPKIRVLVGDDSEISSKEKVMKKFGEYNLKYFDLEKDCGLSAGRNFLLNKVQTKYFVLADDDFVFDKKLTFILLRFRVLHMLSSHPPRKSARKSPFPACPGCFPPERSFRFDSSYCLTVLPPGPSRLPYNSKSLN